MILRTPKPNGPYERSLRICEKRWPQCGSDIEAELATLVAGSPVPNPPGVSRLIGLGVVAMKVRVASTDMQVGKSGGFRVIIVQVDAKTDEWARVVVYAKSMAEDLPRADIVRAIDNEKTT